MSHPNHLIITNTLCCGYPLLNIHVSCREQKLWLRPDGWEEWPKWAMKGGPSAALGEHRVHSTEVWKNNVFWNSHLLAMSTAWVVFVGAEGQTWRANHWTRGLFKNLKSDGICPAKFRTFLGPGGPYFPANLSLVEWKWLSSACPAVLGFSRETQPIGYWLIDWNWLTWLWRSVSPICREEAG